MAGPVTIWQWDEAPEEYRDLSTHGGDEDYVVLIPSGWVESYLVGGAEVEDPVYEVTLTHYQLQLMIDRLGACDTSYHRLSDGSFIAIGVHA